MATSSTIASENAFLDKVAMGTAQDATTNNATEVQFLDENHPLVQRFQDSLNKHLLKHKEKLTFELREVRKDLHDRAKERENVGELLFNVQAEVSRQKNTADGLRLQHTELVDGRTKLERQLEDAQKSLEELQNDYQTRVKEDASLLRQIDKLNGHLHQLASVKEHLQSNIVNLRQSTQKVTSDGARLQADRHKQDAYLNRMMQNVQNLRERIGLYAAQTVSIEQNISATQAMTATVKFEAETLNLEGKQLLDQWNASLGKMRSRDNTLQTIQEAVTEQQNNIRTAENEIRSLSRSIDKEDEVFQTLSSVCNRHENEKTTTTKRLASSVAKTETMRLEAFNLRRNLEDVQQMITAEKNVKAWRETELKKIKETSEGNERERRRLQETFESHTLNGKCTKTSRQSVLKEIREVQDITNQLERTKYKNETDLEKIRSELINTRDHCMSVQLEVDTQRTHIDTCKSENKAEEVKLKQLTALNVKKRDEINALINKVDRLIKDSGGFDMSPLELRLHLIQHDLSQAASQVSGLQREWLEQQTRLKEAAEIEERLGDDHRQLERQLSVYTRHRLQLDEEIERVDALCRTLRQGIQRLRNGLTILNSRAYNEHVQEEQVHRMTILTEDKLMNALTENENELISLRDRAERIRDDEENLSQQLLAAENEMLIWQQKLQLSSEMKSTADIEYKVDGEIHTLQTNLYKMQVRFTELSKQQGGLVHGMEQAVRCWDNLITKGELQMMTASGRKKVSESNSRNELQRQIDNARRKMRCLSKEMASWSRGIQDFHREQEALHRRTATARLDVKRLQANLEDSKRLLQQKSSEKIKNLEKLLILQKQTRLYRTAQENRYTFLHSPGGTTMSVSGSTNLLGDGTTDTEMMIHQMRAEQIIEIITDLEKELPPQFESVLCSIRTRINAGIEFINSEEH